MNAGLRHMAMRFWLTSLVGGLICMSMLPWWQRVAGIHWLLLPCLVFLGAWYAMMGWAMNQLGMGLIRRHLKEASVWDRAGMTAEAETAFQKAVALFDSFWLSPLLRRKKTAWFHGVLARFYLNASTARDYARSVVAGYLLRHPEDIEVVEHWLDQLPLYASHLHTEHEAASRISAALAGHPRIQQLLMQFYLSSGRMDFEARQTCRRVWQSGKPLSDEIVCNLSRMLLESKAMSPWSLQVYLKAHGAGEASAMEGVAACARWLPSTPENRDDLAAAKTCLAHMDPDRRNAVIDLTERFKPVETMTRRKPQRMSRHEKPPQVIDFAKPLNAVLQGVQQQLGRLFKRLPARQWLPRVAIAIVIVMALSISGMLLMRDAPEPPPAATPVLEVPVITDPFTIQVAAYMRAGDAQRFVDQLVEKGLAAFWTKAASANRTWYQVKVSHFATKAAAQAYGNELKSKGLIDDFYVANYEPPAAGGS